MNKHVRQASLLALLPLALTATARAAPVTISPLPGTVAALPGTQISFLGVAPRQLHRISVVGSATGRHRGELRAYASAPGASFVPSRPFKPGERVTVGATLRAGRHAYSLSTSFTVAQPMKVSGAGIERTTGASSDEQSFLSAPSLHPPVIAIDKSTTTAPGYLFAAPFRGPAQYGPMIFDSEGNLVWFKPLRPGSEAADLRVQRYRRHDVLTWWQGHILNLGYGVGVDVIADRHYRKVAVLKAGNGLRADDHDFRLTPHGQALLTAYSPIRNTSSSSGLILDRVVQEIDPKTGLVMREWHSLGSVPVANPRSAQLLPNGNRLLSGAGLPTFTESDRSGETVLAGRLPDGDTSFGVYRYRWSGRPAQAPSVAAFRQSRPLPPPCKPPSHPGEICPPIAILPSQTTIYMSWNGATNVASWRVLGGSSPSGLQPMAEVTRDGFETNVTLPGSETYVQAQALDAAGKVLASSNIVKSKEVNAKEVNE